jgi:AcrR family transcriptional regulator
LRGTDTRERLLDAALALFADRSYARTSVGDIEAAAGLVPRSGGMYRHFHSKEDLLRAAVERELVSTQSVAAELRPAGFTAQDGASVTPGDLRAMLNDTVQVAFDIIGPRLRLRRIFAADDPVLAEPSARFREIVAATQVAAAESFAAIAAQTGRRVDTEALAVFVAAAITQYSADQYTPLRGLLGVDRERFVATLVDTVMTALGVPE